MIGPDDPNTWTVSRETMAEASERELAQAVDNIRLVRAGARAAGVTTDEDRDLVVLALANQDDDQ